MRIWLWPTAFVLAGPVIAGLAGTVLPAFGYFPAAGFTEFSTAPFHDLFQTPGIWHATALSMITGLGATALSLMVVVALMAGWSGTAVFRALERSLSPLLSLPHAAIALGLAMLIAPSGWALRLLSPWLTGLDRPPDLLILHDSWGVTMTLGLITKEVPFLLLMALAAQAQIPDRRAVVASLGYGRVTGWLKAVFPLIYAQIRLPIFAVLAFSMSVVDVALILGPTTPPTLSVLITRWMSDPDLAHRTVAAAGALWQLALTLGALGLWVMLERLGACIFQSWVYSGARQTGDGFWRGAGIVGAAVLIGLAFLGLASLAIWSVAGFWGFPDALPSAISLKGWAGIPVQPLLTSTGIVAGAAMAIAIVLAIGTLSSGAQIPTPLLYLPLIIPQTVFLPGLQILFLRLGIDRGLPPVILAHLTFVLPYTLLSLSGPWAAWDQRYDTAARTLGASPFRSLWRVQLPMMLGPVLTACAIGIAVSVGQYLPTLLLGGGRVATLTTEAVALASGGNRRAIGASALLQALAALLPFAAALLIPVWVWRNRKGMQHA